MSKRPPTSPHPRSPTPADRAFEQAEFAMRMQRPAEAAQIAEGLLKSNRSHLGANVLLGHALLAQNLTDDAIGHLERASRRITDPVLETLLASALVAAGRRDEALTRLRSIVAKHAAYVPAIRAYAAQLADGGQLADGIDTLSRAAAASPAATEIWSDLAALHLRDNDRRAAITALQKARESAPGRPDLLADLARVQLLDGDYAAAADTYRHSLALQPDHAMNRSNLAACQLELGQRDAGETTLRAAVKGHPSMVARGIHALSASSHGRFFLRPSAAEKFLRGES